MMRGKKRQIKPAIVSILTVVVFTAALLVGMQSDWWQLEGRQTPLDGIYSQESEAQSLEVRGSSTVQDALDLGISMEELERVLQGPVDSVNRKVKDIAVSRGLEFGTIKDELNALSSEFAEQNAAR